jgi:hypothetical protein
MTIVDGIARDIESIFDSITSDREGWELISALQEVVEAQVKRVEEKACGKFSNPASVKSCCRATVVKIKKFSCAELREGDEIVCDDCDGQMVWREGAWSVNDQRSRAMRSFTCDYNIGGGGDPCWVQRGQEFVWSPWSEGFRYCVPHFKEILSED